MATLRGGFAALSVLGDRGEESDADATQNLLWQWDKTTTPTRFSHRRFLSTVGSVASRDFDTKLPERNLFEQFIAERLCTNHRMPCARMLAFNKMVAVARSSNQTPRKGEHRCCRAAVAQGKPRSQPPLQVLLYHRFPLDDILTRDAGRRPLRSPDVSHARPARRRR